MHDDRLLSDALKSLPRRSASPRFREQLMARLDAAPVARPLLFRPLVTVALAAALVLTVGVAYRFNARGSARDNELAALLTEHQRLSAELDSVRAYSVKNRPVIRLGGDDRLDYVLDLAQFNPQTATSRPRAVPVSYPTRSASPIY